MCFKFVTMVKVMITSNDQELHLPMCTVAQAGARQREYSGEEQAHEQAGARLFDSKTQQFERCIPHAPSIRPNCGAPKALIWPILPNQGDPCAERPVEAAT